MDKDNTETLRLTVLGARGSIPVHNPRMSVFGGATTCFVVEAGQQSIFIDAGTGIVYADRALTESRDLTVLFTHIHLDHLIGLPFFPPLMEENRRIDIVGVCRSGRSLDAELDGLFRPPYWPCGITEFPADNQYHSLFYSQYDTMREYQVDYSTSDEETEILGREVPHPSGSTAWRITRRGKSIVLVTDAELPVPGKKTEIPLADGSIFDSSAFLNFIQGADLLLMDSQYTQEEQATRRGYGHSTPECAIAWKEAAHVKRLLLVHHDPTHDDAFLQALEECLPSGVSCARMGQVIEV